MTAHAETTALRQRQIGIVAEDESFVLLGECARLVDVEFPNRV